MIHSRITENNVNIAKYQKGIANYSSIIGKAVKDIADFVNKISKIGGLIKTCNQAINSLQTKEK